MHQTVLASSLCLSLFLSSACVGTVPEDGAPDPVEEGDGLGTDQGEPDKEDDPREDPPAEEGGVDLPENYTPPIEWEMSASHYDVEALVFQGEFPGAGAYSIEEGLTYVVDMTNLESGATYSLDLWFMSYPAGTDFGAVDPKRDPLLGQNGAQYLTPPLKVYDLSLVPSGADCSGGAETCEVDEALIFEREQDEGNQNLELIDFVPEDAGARFLVSFPELPAADRDVYLIRTCTSGCTAPSN